MLTKLVCPLDIKCWISIRCA